MSSASIFPYFKTSPEIIRLAVMMYVRYPLSPTGTNAVQPDQGWGAWHFEPFLFRLTATV